MEPDSTKSRRQVLAGVTGLSAASLVSGAAVSPVSARSGYRYQPPAGYELDELVEIYNQNVDAAPKWFRDVVLTSDGIVVYIYNDPSMEVSSWPEHSSDVYTLATSPDGRVESVHSGRPSEKDDDRIIVSVTEDTLDSIILADDPREEVRRQYSAGNIKLDSEGDFRRGLFLWFAEFFHGFASRLFA